MASAISLELRLDPLLHVACNEVVRDANGIPDGLGTGPPMTDDTGSLYSEERRAPVGLPVEPVRHPPEGLPAEPEPCLREDAPSDFLADDLPHHGRERLRALEEDVPHEAVADDDVDPAREDVLALDVAHEPEVRLREPRMRLPRHVVPLGGL